jgi:acetolactate synthase-1/3 small subunit
VSSGTEHVIEQIKSSLERMVAVHKVSDLTVEGPHVERELALVKVSGKKDKRIEALQLAEVFRARILDSTLESFIFEVTGTTEKIDAFIELMKPLGLQETSRTGVVAISRGKKAI